MISKKIRRPERTVLDFPLAVFTAVTLLAVLVSENPEKSFGAIKNYLLISVVYLIGFSITDRKRVRAFLYVMVAAAAASAVYGIADHFLKTGPGLRRTTGTFSIELTYSGIMLLSASMFLAMSVGAPFGRRTRASLYAATVLCAAALFLSFTRSSWLGMFVSTVVTLSFLKRKLILPLLAALVVFVLFMPGKYGDRIGSILDPDYPSNKQRIELLQGGFEIWRENPVLGVGPGDLAEEYSRHMPEGAVIVHGHMHNSYLHVAVTRGILGLVSFIWLLLSFFKLFVSNLKRASHPAVRAWIIGSISALSGFAINGLFEWNFGDAEVVTVLYLVIGSNLALAHNRIFPEREAKQSTNSSSSQ